MSFRFRMVALLPLIMSMYVSLPAQSVPPSATGEDCRNASTTSAMRTCENTRYDAAERELNATYQNLLQTLGNVQKQKLRIAQRAWLRFRDANADFQATLAQGGTLSPLLKLGSLTDKTKARTSELKQATLTAP
jgi:uncharacterized protein YecT (DUF1311 family)